MKRKYIIITMFLFSCFGINAQHEHYYYYKGEKIHLQIDYSRISVISDSKFSENNNKTLNLPACSIKNGRQNFTKQNVISVDRSSDVQHKKDYITEIEFSTPLEETKYFNTIYSLIKQDNIVKVLPTYTFFNQKLGISNNFYVKLFKADDKNKLFNLAEKHAIQILGYNEFMPLWFTLSCTKDTDISSIEAANIFYETGLFESTEPELLYHNLLTSTDTYFTDQWGLKNTGQYGGTSGVDIKAEQAWTITTGSSSIKVAVFDQGIEMNHPDLQNNVYGTGYDATTNTTPSQVRGEHGTLCAGIIGAKQNNAQGISGVAPNSKLMSISIDLDPLDTPQQLANGLNWAWLNGADVISNSWGGYAPSDIIYNAIDSALIYGRNGKGAVVVFASGNSNANVGYPGNSNPGILVVGAISPCGERKSPSSCDGDSLWGSCYGTQLDIVAPGVLIPTTDMQGNNGYNNNTKSDDYSNRDYTKWFFGTSAACPHVSGVAALVLSVNPTLTRMQATDIIEQTAQKIGGYSYQNTAGRLNGKWHQEMGYGLLNAYAAVNRASPTTTTAISNQQYNTSTNITACNVVLENVSVIYNGTVKLTIDDLQGTTTINGPFEVALNAQLEIK